MISTIKKALNREYFPLNKIIISKKTLIANYEALASLNENLKIAPVLKSNAYGHGLVQMAKILDPLNCPMFCVDSLYEAYELLKAKIRTPIFIMGYINPLNLKVKPLNFSYAIYDFKQAEMINKFQQNAKIHIKVDTGMNRLGIPLSDLDHLIKRIKKLPNVQIDGLMSHLSSPKTSKSYTNFQIENYKTALKIFKKNNISVKWKHLGASGGLLNNTNSIAKITNMVRIGISLFGLYRAKSLPQLKPILKMSTRIVQLKQIKKGDFIGYDKAYQAKRDMTIAVLPIGYNDGLDRRLTNIGYVKLKNKFCKIVGKVSMNITTIDVTRLKARIGDEVIIYSEKPQDKNSLECTAKIIDTIPHELLIHLSPTAIRREIQN